MACVRWVRAIACETTFISSDTDVCAAVRFGANAAECAVITDLAGAVAETVDTDLARVTIRSSAALVASDAEIWIIWTADRLLSAAERIASAIDARLTGFARSLVVRAFAGVAAYAAVRTATQIVRLIAADAGRATGSDQTVILAGVGAIGADAATDALNVRDT